MSIFKVGNRITTNNLNVFEILGVNESDICVVDLLNGDFSVMSKTEHKYELTNLKVIFNYTLKEVIQETNISKEDKEFVCEQMSYRFNKWL